MKKHIPNGLTCCNLICGCVATFFAFQADYAAAALFIVVVAVFDFFDGFAARLLGVSSPIGKELDSLADDITFGFAPAAIVFSLLRAQAGDFPPSAFTTLLPFFAFLIAAFSALRLAKFNLDERQTMGFIGLPTPANALFWASLALLIGEGGEQPAFLPWLLLALVLLSCWLLVSEVPMFALKFKHYGLQGNEVRYGFLLFSAATLVVAGPTAFVGIIPAYIIVSLVVHLTKK